jgi:hypothetical protein
MLGGRPSRTPGDKKLSSVSGVISSTSGSSLATSFSSALSTVELSSGDKVLEGPS